MSISQNALLRAKRSVRKTERQRLIVEARSQGKLTAFLCHSHKDRSLAEGVQQWLSEQGCQVYIDWQDEDLPSKPSNNTVLKIKKMIKETDRFFYLATQNSSNSKWCPWEIGYADGKKGADHIPIIPTSRNSITYGQEYLNIYKYIHADDKDGHSVFPAGSTTGGRLIANAI